MLYIQDRLRQQSAYLTSIPQVTPASLLLLSVLSSLCTPSRLYMSERKEVCNKSSGLFSWNQAAHVTAIH